MPMKRIIDIPLAILSFNLVYYVSHGIDLKHNHRFDFPIDTEQAVFVYKFKTKAKTLDIYIVMIDFISLILLNTFSHMSCI